MTEWLLNIGNEYLNKEKVSFVGKIMCCVVLLPVGLLILGILGSRMGDELRIIGQISDLTFDLCLATACLAIMTLVYADGKKLPVIGYFVVITVIKGVYQFFIASIGGKGELYTLIFVLCFVLHITVGVQLLNTRYSVLGKAMLCYIVGVAIAAAVRASHLDALSSIIVLVTGCMLAYTFYKYLPTYYE